MPLVVAGSNGRVAWGYTNSEGDWADLVVLWGSNAREAHPIFFHHVLKGLKRGARLVVADELARAHPQVEPERLKVEPALIIRGQDLIGGVRLAVAQQAQDLRLALGQGLRALGRAHLAHQRQVLGQRLVGALQRHVGVEAAAPRVGGVHAGQHLAWETPDVVGVRE